MLQILRGTTPTLRFRVNTSDFLVTDIVKLQCHIWAKHDFDKVYTLEDVQVDSESNSFSIKLQEAETLKLRTKDSVYWQVRCAFADGTIVGTHISDPIEVPDLKYEEAMSDE